MKKIETFFPEYFSQSDRQISIGALAFSMLSLILLISIKPQIKTRSSEPVAVLKDYKKKVSHKVAGSVSFYDARPFEKLSANDEIFTGENSKATIQFLKSKNEVIVPSGSLVRIEDSLNGETIEIKEGIAEFIIKKDSSLNLIHNGKKINVETKGDQGAIKAYMTNGELVLNATSGDLKVNYKGKDIDLDKRESLSLAQGNQKLEVSEFKLISPIPGETYDAEKGVELSFSGVKKIKVSFAESPDRLFKKYELVSTSGYTFATNISKEGGYYVGIETEKNERLTIPIKLQYKNTLEMEYPRDGEVLSMKPGESVTLKWNDQKNRKYKVKLIDNFGNEVVKMTSDKAITLSKIKGDSFRWMVLPEIKKGIFPESNKEFRFGINYSGELQFKDIKNKLDLAEKDFKISWSKGSSERFKLIAKNAETGAVIEKIVKENEVHLENLAPGKYSVDLVSLDYPSLKPARKEVDVVSTAAEWSSQNIKKLENIDPDDFVKLDFKPIYPELKKLKVEVVYTAPNGKTEVDDYNLLDKAFETRLEKFGKYCFKITTKEKNNYYYQSNPHCLTYNALPAFQKPTRAKDTILTYAGNGDDEVYQFTVPQIPRAEKYKVEIYQDTDMTKVVYKNESKQNSFKWESDLQGVYYLRYKVIDSKGRESELSPYSKLIFPISPLTDWNVNE